jgi:hypothetical protein
MEIEVQLTGSPIAEKFLRRGWLRTARGWNFAARFATRKRAKKFPHWNMKPTGNGRARNPAHARIACHVNHPCLAAKVIHRVGIIPVGEAAIYVGIASRHRAEAIALLGEFMNHLKQGVPIWKRRALLLR